MNQKDIFQEIHNSVSDLEYQQAQMQQFQQKMSLEQVQELANCIKVLGNTLSFAENYSAMNGNTSKSEFTNYDYFYASKNTEKSLYFKKFAAAINNYDNIYDYYVSKYKQEPLPKSLTKMDIVKRINKYKEFVKDPKDLGLYDDFIKVFSRNSINNVHNIVNSFKGDGTMDPHKIQNTFLNAKGHVDQQNQQIQEQYNNDPNFRPDMILGADKPSIVQDNVGVGNNPYQNQQHHPHQQNYPPNNRPY